MSRVYVIYNPLANNGRSREAMEEFARSVGECVLCDMTKGYEESIKAMAAEDSLIICGGDGTLNRFVNEVNVEEIAGDILYFACGSGNDFAHDISLERGDAPVSIKKYLLDLPCVEINGRSYKFINAI